MVFTIMIAAREEGLKIKVKINKNWQLKIAKKYGKFFTWFLINFNGVGWCFYFSLTQFWQPLIYLMHNRLRFLNWLEAHSRPKIIKLYWFFFLCRRSQKAKKNKKVSSIFIYLISLIFELIPHWLAQNLLRPIWFLP